MCEECAGRSDRPARIELARPNGRSSVTGCAELCRPVSSTAMPFTPMCLAIISDLHVGGAATAADLCPLADRDATRHDPDFLDRFLSFVEEEGLQPDWLVLPGDATHRAQPDEAAVASKAISRIAETILPDSESAVFVPGNHDVDWSVLENLDGHGVRWGQRYDTLMHAEFVFPTITGRAEGDLFAPPHFAVWDSPELLVVGYNSSHHDEPAEEIHHGRAELDDLDAIRAHLQNVDLADDRLKLLLIHHHPVLYDSLIPEHVDFSALQNANALRHLVTDLGFDAIIHGHMHVPSFRTTSWDGGRPVAIVCAGSFSLQLPSQWTGAVTNQFHVLDILDRDPQTGVVRGQLRSWSYSFVHGWRPSHLEHNGIAHSEPFGSYHDQEALRAALLAALQPFTETDVLKFSDIVENDPALAYARPPRVIEVVNQLAEEGHLIVHQGPELDGMLFLRGEEDQ